MKPVEGPFFHGTRATLRIGDELKPGHASNFRQRPLQHVYFTATLDAAKWGAELAQSDAPERIYLVEPLGAYEDDPNLTDQRIPGNPTRSYRSTEPVKIIAELGTWERHTDEEIEKMRASLQRLRAEGKDTIID